MRGFGFECDECEKRAVIKSDVFATREAYGPMPEGWVRANVMPSDTQVAIEGHEFCSFRCVSAFYEREAVELERFVPKS